MTLIKFSLPIFNSHGLGYIYHTLTYTTHDATHTNQDMVNTYISIQR